jgi:hypothetical protein
MRRKIFFLILLCSLVIDSCDQSKSKEAQTPVNQKRGYNDTYHGKNLNRIAFPIGGIGAGMLCMEGTGAFSHVSVRNTAEVYNEPLMFAAISVKNWANGAKLLEGPVPTWKYFGSPNTANGGERTSYGLPRFRNADFQARFPFAKIHLTDQEIPLSVNIEG